MIYFQMLSLALSIFGILTWGRWALKNRKYWLYAVPPITWMVHAALFYLAFMTCKLPDAGFFNNWSTVLRLHAVILVVSVVFFLPRKTG